MNAALAPTHRLLVADDEPALTRLLTVIFEDAGYHVTTASSVEQACTLLAATAFDLVLADTFSVHKDRSFVQTGPILQAAGATPVVLFTAHAINQEAAIAVGFCDLIAKPFDLDAFLGRVQELLVQSGQVRSSVSASV